MFRFSERMDLNHSSSLKFFELSVCVLCIVLGWNVTVAAADPFFSLLPTCDLTC